MLHRVSALQPTLGRLLSIAAPVAALGFATDAFADDDKNPYAMADGTWITISGEVGAVDPDHFTLDYGDGLVVVEMDDGDRDADAYKLLQGDKVTVAGRIDDDFFEAPFGSPSAETMLAVTYQKGVNEGRLDLCTLII